MPISVAFPYVAPGVSANVLDALSSAWLSPGGKYSTRFREQIGSMYNKSNVVLTNSGTSAIEVALLSVGRVYGKASGAVLMPAYTCPDTLMAVLKAGYEPVICDVDETRCCLTAQTLSESLSSTIVGVVPVHIYGMMVPIDVYSVARKHGLFIVDDACEAFGGTVSGMSLADLSDAVCFSFRGEKLLPIGTGGAIVTKHAGVYGVAESLVGLNSPNGAQRYWCADRCLSYEYPEVLSAIGCAQIEVFLAEISRRLSVVELYRRQGIAIPFRAYDVPWKMPIKVRDPVLAYDFFSRAGIEITPPFVPLHRLPGPAYLPRFHKSEVVSQRDRCLLGAEFLYEHVVALPLHSHLQDADVAQIISTWRAFERTD